MYFLVLIIFIALISLLLISPKWSFMLVGLAISGFPGAAIGFALGYLLELVGKSFFRNKAGEGSYHEYTWGPFSGQTGSNNTNSGTSQSDAWEAFWEQFARQQQQYQQQYGQGYGQQGGYGGYGQGYSQTRAGLGWAYSELGLSESATDDELKATYRKLALQYHPDRHATDSEEKKKEAEEKFKKINEAYNAIKTARGID